MTARAVGRWVLNAILRVVYTLASALMIFALMALMNWIHGTSGATGLCILAGLCEVVP